MSTHPLPPPSSNAWAPRLVARAHSRKPVRPAEIDCLFHFRPTAIGTMVRPRRGGEANTGAKLSRYYLGVDGGGTNCRIRLTDANLVTLADAAGGRSNLQIAAGGAAFRVISEGTREVFAKAGIDFPETANTYAFFGMAGGRLPSARDAFEKRPWPFAAVKVYDDIDIARAGAHGGEDGAVIIVGTGSAAMALVRGERHQAGG